MLLSNRHTYYHSGMGMEFLYSLMGVKLTLQSCTPHQRTHTHTHMQKWSILWFGLPLEHHIHSPTTIPILHEIDIDKMEYIILFIVTEFVYLWLNKFCFSSPQYFIVEHVTDSNIYETFVL